MAQLTESPPVPGSFARGGRGSPPNYSFPGWMLLPAGLALLLLIGPLAGLLGNIPWSRAGELLTAPSAVSSLKLSLLTASTSTLCCLLLGLPLSLLLTRMLRQAERTGRTGRSTVLSLFVYAPLVLSPVVSGLAMLYFWGRNAVLGGLLDEVGLGVTFTPWAVVLVQIFVAMPFFTATAVTALSGIPERFEEIAATEGATRMEIIRRVLIPSAAPGLVTAMLLSFARALGEYGATITFAGNILGQTRTIPLNIDIALNSNDVPAALGSCIMLLALYLMLVGLIGAARMVHQRRRGRADA